MKNKFEQKHKIDYYQKRYDQLKAKMNYLTEIELKENNLYLSKDTVKEDRETFGIFYEVTNLYDYFEDGIYLCHYEKNALELTKEKLKTISDYLKNEDKTSNTFSKIMESETNLHPDIIDIIEETFPTDIVEELEAMLEGDNFSLEIQLDDDYEEISVGSIVDNSRFAIKKCLFSEIEKYEKEATNTTYSL